MRRFILHWLVITVSLAVTALVLPGVEVETLSALLLGGLALGFINAVVRPVLRFLTFPLTIFTLGLSLLLINGLAFAMATWVVEGLVVRNFGWAIGASVVVSLLSSILAWAGSSGGDGSSTRQRAA